MSSSPFVTPARNGDEKIIIWVSIDNQIVPLDRHCSTSIRYYPESGEPCPSWFEKANIKHIRTTMGTDSTFTYDRSNLRALPQGIVTAEILRHLYPYSIVYVNSAAHALALLLTLNHTEQKRTFVWLDAHQELHPHDWMYAYDTLTNECGRIFPPREEIVWADFKIYDIRTFDRIAEADAAYRPLTCYPDVQSHCVLSKSCKSILKRSHSCCASRVQIKEISRQRPACEQNLPVNEDDKIDVDGYYRWVHQEYVPSLVDFGEFRVFVATKAGADGQRQPYIVHVIRTKWLPSPKNPREVIGHRYEASEVTPSSRWPEYPDVSYDKLTTYALHIYRQLQESGEVGFQSLNVGGRLDIGISPDGKEYFVNELTRWYGAHQFAMDTQSPPYDRICRAYATAFAETLGVEPRDIAVEDVNAKSVSRGKAVGEKKAVVRVGAGIVPDKVSKRKLDSFVDGSTRSAKVRKTKKKS